MEKIKILLVDDDLKFGNIAVKILQKAGYDVFFQNSLFGVESLIMKLSPNLIILDVMIGEENSLERINDIRLAAEAPPSCAFLHYTTQNLKPKLPTMGL